MQPDGQSDLAGTIRLGMQAAPSRPKRVQQGFLVIFGLLATWVCFVIVQPFLLSATAALALAVLFHPMQRQFERWGLRPTPAAAITVLIVLLAVLTPMVMLAIGATRELRELFGLLARESNADGGWEPWLTHVLERPLGWFGIHADDPDFRLRVLLGEWAEASRETLMRGLRGAISNIVNVVLSVVVTLFTLFFLLRDGDRIREEVKRLVPIEPAVTDELFHRVTQTVIANMYGVVAVATVQGGLTGLAFLALGLGNPVLWTVMAALMSMIPLVGASSVWVGGAIWLVVKGAYVKALILTGFGAGVIGLADNFIRPYVVSGPAKLHPLLVFFALLGGARAFGLVGIFIGPAVLSVTLALWELLQRPRASATPPGEPSEIVGAENR